ncbi:MAG: epoxyqueuosine reductase QueH [Bacilli bacterium]|nr:epoxyqueuosine reductase QueH [Bacilli bacterium]
MNYQNELDKAILSLDKIPTLLLHSCCGPCSSYVLEYLSKYFSITVFYYNPNIDTKDEFEKRLQNQIKVINEMPFANKVSLIEGEYDSSYFLNYIKGLEDNVEGGERCHKCYLMRLEETAKLAKEKNFDYFCTTLTVSPYKNAFVMNEIGRSLEKKYGVKYLYSDFKKKEGYKRSIVLSKEYDLYRQDYCGCVFSRRDNIDE